MVSHSLPSVFFLQEVMKMFNLYSAFIQHFALAAVMMLAPLMAQAQTQSPRRSGS